MRTEADMHDRQLAVIQRLTRELDAARADRDRYKAALEFYADPNNWITSDGRAPQPGWTNADDDLGALARQALKSGQGEGKS